MPQNLVQASAIKPADQKSLIARKLYDLQANKTLKSLSQGQTKQIIFFRLMSSIIKKKIFILSCKFEMLKPPVAIFQPPRRAQCDTCTWVKSELHGQHTLTGRANTAHTKWLQHFARVDLFDIVSLARLSQGERKWGHSKELTHNL